MNDHSFDSNVADHLIRNEELAEITYSAYKDTLPAGMTTHDVYILH